MTTWKILRVKGFRVKGSGISEVIDRMHTMVTFDQSDQCGMPNRARAPWWQRR